MTIPSPDYRARPLRTFARSLCIVAALTAQSVVVQAEELWQTVNAPTILAEPVFSGMTSIDGAAIYHAEWGEGSTVLLLYGGLGSIETWALQIPELAENYHVVAIDTRGHGRSSRDERPFSFELMTNDVIAVMDEPGLENPVIIGTSDGGIIAMMIAMQHPERLSRALAMGTNFDPSGVDPTVMENPTVGVYVGQAAAKYASSPQTQKASALLQTISRLSGPQNPTLPKASYLRSMCHSWLSMHWKTKQSVTATPNSLQLRYQMLNTSSWMV